MRLRVLGSSGTYPVVGNPASGYLVDRDGISVMLDTGPGSFAALQEVMDPGALDAVVVSHVHFDHCLDLFSLFTLLRYRTPATGTLPVFVPEGAALHLAAFARAGPDHDFYRVFDWRTVGSGDHAEIGPFVLRFGAAAHPVPALVVGMEAEDGSLAYSGDTGPGGDLADLAVGASALLCEATMQGERTRDTYPYHLTAAEAGEVAAAAGAGRLYVTHVAPTLDPAVSVAEAAARYRGPVEWAAPGLEVDV
jgi:ribonuclease BN (tRNA processing enzyme)